jgi:hypothetical protein
MTIPLRLRQKSKNISEGVPTGQNNDRMPPQYRGRDTVNETHTGVLGNDGRSQREENDTYL